MLSKVVFSCEYLYYIPWFFGMNSGTIFRGLWCYIPVMNYGTIFRLDADIWCYIPVVKNMVLYSDWMEKQVAPSGGGRPGKLEATRSPKVHQLLPHAGKDLLVRFVLLYTLFSLILTSAPSGGLCSIRRRELSTGEKPEAVFKMSQVTPEDCLGLGEGRRCEEVQVGWRRRQRGRRRRGRRQRRQRAGEVSYHYGR